MLLAKTPYLLFILFVFLQKNVPAFSQNKSLPLVEWVKNLDADDDTLNKNFNEIVNILQRTEAFLVKKNMATQKIISFNINYPLTLKWYTLFTNLNTYYSRYKADFGPGRTVDLDVYAFNMYMQHSFNMGKGWKGEISGWYVSPSIWQGFSRSSKMWSMDAGLQKIIFNGAGNCKIFVSDIFQTMRWKGASDFAGQHNISNGGWESRLLKLNVTWRFGNTQMKANRERKTGVEEENKRVTPESSNQNRQ